MFMEALFIAAKRKKKAKSLSVRSRKCGIATQWNIVQQQKGVNYRHRLPHEGKNPGDIILKKKKKNTKTQRPNTKGHIL